MEGFSGLFAEGLLKRHPALQVEALDHLFESVGAYSLYELAAEGQLMVSLVDKAERCERGSGCTFRLIESIPSQAAYVLRKEDQGLAYRLNKHQYILRRIDGQVVATATGFSYADTDANKSLLNQPWGRVEQCGPRFEAMDNLIKLVDRQS